MRLLLILALLSAAGCGDLFGTVESREMAVIKGFHVDDPQIQLPEQATAGQAFIVEILTYGTECHRAGEVEVWPTDNGVTLTPYNYRDERRRNCSRAAVPMLHTASVSLTSPGAAEVRIQGREAPDGDVIFVVREVVVE